MAPTTMSNTIAFPSVSVPASTTTTESSLSLSVTNRTTALEICNLVYGPERPSWEVMERFYEPNATYENPLVTATSRDVIADIHTLSSRLGQMNISKPLALLYGLFGASRDSDRDLNEPWLKLINMWDEVIDVSDNESFDGHHKAIVEHTLHIDLLSGLFSSSSASPSLPSIATDELTLSMPNAHPLSRHTSLGFGTRARGDETSPSSLLRLSLPVITRLSFNDVGKISHHRDFWDVKDLLGLLPGMSLAQWVATRLVAQSIRGIVGTGRLFLGARSLHTTGITGARDVEEGLSQATAYAGSVKISEKPPTSGA